MPAVDTNPSTNLSLIRRMIDTRASGVAWPEFHQRYRGFLRQWCRRWGVSQQDVDDILQDSLVIVFRNMPEFERQRRGAFRSWMKRITLRAWLKHLRKTQRSLASNQIGEQWRNRLFGPGIRSGTELLDLLDRIADAEIFELALLQVRQNVSEKVWEIFELSELRQVPIAEVAAKMGISPTAVRVSNYRFRKRLRASVERFGSS